MRVLQVIPYFAPAFSFGGSVEVAYHISKKLVERGHSVTVYTSDARDFRTRLDVADVETLEGIEVRYFSNLTMKTVGSAKLFVTPDLIPRAAEEIGDFEVIHLHEYRTFQGAVVAHFARKKGIPYVLHAHGTLPTYGVRTAAKALFDACVGKRMLAGVSRVIALSPVEVGQFHRYGIPDRKIEVIPNGIEEREYEVLPSPGAFREALRLDADSQVVLFVGRINRAKGIDFLLKGFQALCGRGMATKAVLIIAGPDEGFLKGARDLAQELRIQDRVLFPGPLFGRHKREAYEDSDVVASLDSLPEVVFLMVPLEAAACNTPVLMADSNYLSGVAERQGFGVSVPYGDVNRLARALEDLLLNPELRRKMGNAGRQFVLANYTWSRRAMEVEQLYRRVVTGS